LNTYILVRHIMLYKILDGRSQLQRLFSVQLYHVNHSKRPSGISEALVAQLSAYYQELFHVRKIALVQVVRLFGFFIFAVLH